MSGSKKYTSVPPHDVQRSREQHYSEKVSEAMSDMSVICFVLQFSAPLVMYALQWKGKERVT
eukprot:1140718-Pelagomonas_calceolata.AAC.12